MKTHSAYNQTAADNPNVSPIRLVKIEFDGLTVYGCDRAFGDPGSEYEFDSQIYEPIILSWGDLQYGEVGQLGKAGTPSDFSFRVDNTVPIAGFDSFTAIFSTYKPIFSTVTVYEFFEGGSVAADLINRFSGSIEDVDMELEHINVNCTSFELAVANQLQVEICTEEDYPGADPDDWGKMLPIVYGSVKRAPFVNVDAGAMDALAADIDSSATTMYGSDLSKFPPGGGTLQVDYEEMTYVFIDGNAFKGVVRGANGTDAISHDTGATIAEIQTEYYFVLAHPVKSIDAVYVVNRNNDENVLQDASLYTLYTGQTGDEHATYPGKACIVFNTLPTIAPQVNLDVEDTIDVDDTIDVNDTIDVDDPSHAHGGDAYGIWHTEWGYNITGYAPDPSNAFDGALGSYCQLWHGQTEIRGQKLYAEELGALPKAYRANILIDFCDSNVGATVTFASSTFNTPIGTTGIFRDGSWRTASWTNWSQIQAIETYLKNRASGGTPGIVQVRDTWIEFQQDQVTPDLADVSKTGAAAKEGEAAKIGTVELIGNSVADTVIGGKVSADVQGWEADDSGNYGTEGDVIQRPDYVFKHFLVNYCGLTIASNIDSTSYSASGALYAADNVQLAVLLLERPEMVEFLALTAQQSKSYEFWEAGKHYLKRIPVTESTDKTIEGGRIDIDSVKVRYTPRDQVINKYVVNFDKHWIGDFESDIESYRGVIVVESISSQAIYGVLEGDPFNLPFVNNSTQALRLGNWFLDDTGFPRLIVEFSGGQYFSELERGDILEFSFTAGDELDRRFLGLVVPEADQFRIMRMVEAEEGKFTIEAYIVVSSTSNTGAFYPEVIDDDGYTQGANFYNTTVSNVIGNYSGAPAPTVTTTSASTTTSTTASTTTSTSSSSTTTTTTA
jgi:hypothetical protein